MKIAVIGAGPAGMMAAITAAQQGADVTLYEKNEKTGKKIYITGKGRCNVTNNCSNEEFLANVVTNPKFLMSAINKWSSGDTMQFFENAGQSLKTERGNRVFPVSDKASDISKVLNRKLSQLQVNIQLNTPVLGIKATENGILLNTISDIVLYNKVIIACGGTSYSKTGSNGDGYNLARSIGHTIVTPKAALSEIMVKEDTSSLEGLSLKNVNLAAYSQGKEIASFFGEMLFTRNGISGPIALSLSSFINKLASNGQPIDLRIDLKPALYLDGRKPDLDERIQRDFAKYINKEFCNSLGELLPDRLSDYIINISNIPAHTRVNKISAEQRKQLAKLIKGLPLTVSKLADIERAIVTSGGVSTKEINPSTMQSKLCANLYFAGEVIDVDALTGGFNMQIAFSTGYVAGLCATK